MSEFFCCFFFGVCNLSTRSQGIGQPIRRARTTDTGGEDERLATLPNEAQEAEPLRAGEASRVAFVRRAEPVTALRTQLNSHAESARTISGRRASDPSIEATRLVASQQAGIFPSGQLTGNRNLNGLAGWCPLLMRQPNLT